MHVDGLPAVLATTIVVGASDDAPVDGDAAKVIEAAYLAAECVKRLLKPKVQNTKVTEIIAKARVGGFFFF